MSSVKKKNKLRKSILQLHKIIGLSTGLVVFIVSITGCFWVFKDEIESFYTAYKHVIPLEQEFIAPSLVKTIAENEIPDKVIHGVVYGKPNEALEVVFYQAEPDLFYQSLFINPYTGNVLKRVDHTIGFFSFILDGHLKLWLPDAIGSTIVTYSVLLFFIILISGLYLWWPKKKKNRKQRFQFNWNSKTRWKRKNFDLHTVIGFYISSFALALTFTGCIMAFNWFYFIAYKTTGGTKVPQFIMPKNTSALSANNSTKPIYDKLLSKLQHRYPSAESFELHYPENASTALLIEAYNTKGLHYDIDYLFFDQNTLLEIETPSIYGRYENASFADKVIRMNYDIHIGIIGGLVGKIIAFFASLVCATLPVSGFLLWYGRKYKKKKTV